METDGLSSGSDDPPETIGSCGDGSGAFSGVIGVGVDLVDVPRMAAALVRTPGLVERLFTSDERAYCETARKPGQRFAVRFAAKEAAMKALGVGLGAVSWHDVEVVRSDSGAPSLLVTGRAADLAAAQRGTRWQVSLTHTSSLAEAVVVLSR